MASKKEKKRSRDKAEDQQKVPLKHKISEILELPKEIVMNVPKLTMVGNSDLVVENYKGIIEYSSERIRVNTGAGIIKLTGRRLIIREITSEDILISGDIASLEFLK